MASKLGTATKYFPEILNPHGTFPGLIVVDHAGTLEPEEFSLHLPPEWQDTHHFCDLGVADLARRIAREIDIPIVLAPVSRLVIDLNRWIADPDSIVLEAEGISIPGNAGLGVEEKNARAEALFWPYHAAVARIWKEVNARSADPFFFALHSCTRIYAGERRIWDGGTIWHEDPRLALDVIKELAEIGGGAVVLGSNKPYSGKDGIFTPDYHTFGTGRRACGFEVTNDQLDTEQGRATWASYLSQTLRNISVVDA